MAGRFGKLGELVESASFAARVLRGTGMLGALSPTGVVEFARRRRGARPGPHTTLLLHACNQPTRVALVDANRRMSWRALDGEVNQLGHALVAAGVRGGDRVGLMMRNCCEFVVAQQACARIGATAVQIGYRLKPQEIAYILANSQARALVFHDDYSAFVAEARMRAGIPPDDALFAVGARSAVHVGKRYEDAIARFDPNEPPGGRYSMDGGVMTYTSGTTGKPKGATRKLRDTGLAAVGDFMHQIGFHADERHLVVCPLYHSGAMAFFAFAFTLGATTVLLEHFDERIVLETIERERITSAFLVPTMLARLAAFAPDERARFDTSSLAWVCSGAAPLPTTTAQRFQDAFGPLLWNFYGATEIGLVSLAGPADHGARPGTVGRPLRGNELRVLDAAGREVPPGEIGELYARSAMLIGGYHDNPDATAAAMRNGYFSVGDLAHIDADGYLYLHSRKTDMVISGGVNIYPREIEDHLLTHPDIAECAVIGVPDDEWGEALKAFVVPRRPRALTAEDVVLHCQAALANYKRPRYVEFIDALPRNPTGKVLKRELRERS